MAQQRIVAKLSAYLKDDKSGQGANDRYRVCWHQRTCLAVRLARWKPASSGPERGDQLTSRLDIPTGGQIVAEHVKACVMTHIVSSVLALKAAMRFSSSLVMGRL